eukprot:10491491-Alexandrium_andersonii.AAC.1
MHESPSQDCTAITPCCAAMPQARGQSKFVPRRAGRLQAHGQPWRARANRRQREEEVTDGT